MADLRIVDAPEIPTENITGEEKLPTGGSGNYSISLDSLADYTKTKKDLADNTSVDGKVNGVRQELDAHIEDLLNPHQVTKGQIGLGNVDNTADADKPVSNSTQSAIISAVAPKADKTYVDNQLTLKANKADVYTKQESSDLVNNSISTALTPVNASLDLVKRGTANRYDLSLTYNSGERVVLTNGDIVKSTIDGNTNDPNVNMTGWVKTNSASQVFDESGKTQQDVNDAVFNIEYANMPDARKYPIIADKVTDNTAVIYQAIQDMAEGSELFIPPNVKWDNSPANVYPLMKNYTRIEDHSGYDSRYPSVWHHHVVTFQHTTENTGTTNGNGIINRGDYHPYFCVIVDTPDGGAGSRGSLIIRQDGEMLQLGTDKTQAGQECFAISTYGDIVEGSKAMRVGMQKSSAPHCFAYNSSLITDITYVYGKHLKRPDVTDPQYLAANHSTRHTQPANHTGSFLTTYFVGASEKFRQNIDKDGNLIWRSSGSTARFNFDNTGALFGHIKKTRVGSISGTIGVDDSHSFFSNYGAVGGQSINLPAPKAGYYLEISIDAAHTVTVIPSTGTQFLEKVAGKNKSSNTVGSKIKLTGLDATTWSVEQVGTWVDEA